MFTGIVKSVETVIENKIMQGMHRLTITKNHPSLKDSQIDDSIAVNGVCLTIVAKNANDFSFDVLPETLRLTNLGALKENQLVNIEPALKANDPMGGHNVQGHIDAKAQITHIQPDGEALNIHFALTPQLAAQNIPKGFIAVDGISLTLTAVGKDYFAVMLIPHTQKQTCAQFWQVGDDVNIEIDAMAKMVFHFYQQRENI
ncbi:MAG: riboflavin synthase [Alphaproteobacteria bacterium]